MQNIIKYVNFILIVSLLFMISLLFQNKNIIMQQHHIMCTTDKFNESMGITYKYYFELTTDKIYNIKQRKYVSILKYNDKYYYNSAKTFYKNLDYEVEYNDKSMEIKITDNTKTSNNIDNNYYRFKKSIENSGYKCEEVL